MNLQKSESESLNRDNRQGPKGTATSLGDNEWSTSDWIIDHASVEAERALQKFRGDDLSRGALGKSF